MLTLNIKNINLNNHPGALQLRPLESRTNTFPEGFEHQPVSIYPYYLLHKLLILLRFLT